MFAMQSLHPSEHHLPVPVRQGAVSVKTSKEISRFQMTDCTVTVISSKGISLPSFHKILVTTKMGAARERLAADCAVQFRTGLNSV